MRRGFASALLVVALLGAAAQGATAAEGGPWRATSPRVRFRETSQRLELVIPRGRARGATSRAIPIEPGQTYLASTRLDLDTLIARGAFIRVALYPTADGSGRQQLRLDSGAVRQDADGAVVLFDAPAWARAAKLRVLARPDRRATVDATAPTLIRIERAPVVVLRTDE